MRIISVLLVIAAFAAAASDDCPAPIGRGVMKENFEQCKKEEKDHGRECVTACMMKKSSLLNKDGSVNSALGAKCSKVRPLQECLTKEGSKTGADCTTLTTAMKKCHGKDCPLLPTYDDLETCKADEAKDNHACFDKCLFKRTGLVDADGETHTEIVEVKGKTCDDRIKKFANCITQQAYDAKDAACKSYGSATEKCAKESAWD